MKKTAEQIAQHVVVKLAKKDDQFHVALNPKRRLALSLIGGTGGGIAGSLFGGLSGAAIGDAMRTFPGQKPTTRTGRALSKVFRNPVGKAVANAFPYVGMLGGSALGAYKGYRHVQTPKTNLSDEDVRLLIEDYIDGLG